MIRSSVLLLILLLAGCGQMGPLYFPADEPSQQPSQNSAHNSSTTHHNNTNATDGKSK